MFNHQELGHITCSELEPEERDKNWFYMQDMKNSPKYSEKHDENFELSIVKSNILGLLQHSIANCENAVALADSPTINLLPPPISLINKDLEINDL